MEGTAVFVQKNGAFITPRHVLNGITGGARQNPCPFPAIYVPEDGIWHVDQATFRIHFSPFIPNLCKVVVDTHFDVAYCSPVPGTLSAEVSPVVFEQTPPPDGTPVAFTGFPLSNTVPLTTLGAIASYSATDELGTSMIVVDKANWPGASGSPIYLTDGRVVGILVARGAGEGSGLTCCWPCRLSSDQLCRWRNSQTTELDDCLQESIGNTWECGGHRRRYEFSASSSRRAAAHEYNNNN